MVRMATHLVLLGTAGVTGTVVPARAQMATTLGFHIILACLGIALPTVVLIAEFIGLRRSDPVAMTLARRWSQAMGVLVAVGLAAALTPVQIYTGDTAARSIAADQPVKFASMEYVPQPSRHVPEWLGGVYVNGHIYGGLRIPDFDSLLVGFGPGTRVTGWDSVPAAQRPPVVWLIHLCFDVMVGLGFLLLLAGLWAAWAYWRQRRLPGHRLFWLLGAVSGVAASWPWSAAGWSPRSGGSPGWCTGCRPPRPRPPATAGCWPA
jgi:cytochrome bd-type quinol oxidase subunit 1